MKRVSKFFNSRRLVVFAVFLATVFCGETLVRGYDFYASVSSGSKSIYDVDLSNYLSRFRVGSQYLGLTIIYLIWLVRNWKINKFYEFSDLLKVTSIFLAIAWIAYPVTSDIYLYLQYGLMSLNQLNPYLVTSGNFLSNLSPFIFWDQTSTYGPVSQLFFMASAFFLSFNTILGVYIFKLICLLAHLLNSYLIWRHLKKNPHQRIITTAYLINPLLLFEQVTEAHIDVFVCTSIILLITFFRTRNYLASCIAIWLGFLTKTLPIIWLPLFLGFLIRKRLWKKLFSAILFSILILFSLKLSLLPSIESWTTLFNPGIGDLVSGSLHDLLRLALNSKYAKYVFPISVRESQEFVLAAFRSLTYFGFASYYAWILLKSYWIKNYSENKLVADIGWVTLVLLLFATPWLMPWYPSILVPFIALNINFRLFALTSFTFGLVLSCAFYTLGYGPLYGQILPGVIGTVLATIPAIAILLLGRKIWRFPQFEKWIRGKGLNQLDMRG